VVPSTELATSASLTDAEVVRRVRAGETALFEVLVRRHDQRVYRTVRSILRDEAEAEDAMQQAWLQAWRKLGQLADAETFGGWVTRIAANEALSRLRRADAIDPWPEDDMEPVGPGNPEAEASRAELVQSVEAAADRLSQAQRAVFMLRDVEGLSTEETAAALGLSPNAVKVRLHRAHAALRRAVGDGVEEAPRAFRFEAPRCNRIVEWVLARIAEES
jgi:RNA polymerase sigma-70 factor, ECF subfamily